MLCCGWVVLLGSLAHCYAPFRPRPGLPQEQPQADASALPEPRKPAIEIHFVPDVPALDVAAISESPPTIELAPEAAPDEACPSPLIQCGPQCVDIEWHSDHCGGCFRACPPSSQCQQGSCVCDVGTMCSGQCVDLTTNKAHCGSCNTACKSGDECKGGACKTPPPTCPSGQTMCSGSCVDLQQDDKNCGKCGQVCGTASGSKYQKTQQKRVGSGRSVNYTYSSLKPAAGSITVQVKAYGDYTSDSEYVLIHVDGKSYGRFTPDTANTVTKTIKVDKKYANDKKLTVRLTNSKAVDDSVCTVTVKYTTLIQLTCSKGKCQ